MGRIPRLLRVILAVCAAVVAMVFSRGCNCNPGDMVCDPVMEIPTPTGEQPTPTPDDQPKNQPDARRD